MALGNHQVEGISFKETYASVGRTDTLRLLIAIAAYMRCRVFSFDIITAFLHGIMKEKAYVCQVRGFEAMGQEDCVWELEKSLYGTRKGARDFSEHLELTLKDLGFVQSLADAAVYIRRKGSGFIFIHMHVDDGFLISTCDVLLEEFKKGLLCTYQYKWREKPASHLGIHLTYNEDGSIFIDQAHYLEDILETFQMEDCNPVKTPFAPNTSLSEGSDEEIAAAKHLPYMSLVGSLMYAAVCTRPDISYAVGKLSQFNSCYTEFHWLTAKHVLRYLKGSLHRGILYQSCSDVTLRGYADADYANDKASRRLVTGYLFTYSPSIISWKSRRQRTVALSTTEAEYMSISDCSRHALWIKKVFEELNVSLAPNSVIKDSISVYSSNDAISIFNDNNGTIILTKDPVINDRSKHIDICYHFIREKVKEKLIATHHIPTFENPADYLTKPLSHDLHLGCLSRVFNIENNC